MNLSMVGAKNSHLVHVFERGFLFLEASSQSLDVRNSAQNVIMQVSSYVWVIDQQSHTVQTFFDQLHVC